MPYALFSANGTPGPQGIQGEKGSQGIQGVKGETGLTGPAGADSVTSADNGLTIANKVIKLGGALTAATSIFGLTATNNLSITDEGVNAFSVAGTTLSVDATNNKVGIGNNAPAEKLDVTGKIKTTGFIMPTGAATNKVLTSDASGNATWATPSAMPAGTVARQMLYWKGTAWVNIAPGANNQVLKYCSGKPTWLASATNAQYL